MSLSFAEQSTHFQNPATFYENLYAIKNLIYVFNYHLMHVDRHLNQPQIALLTHKTPPHHLNSTFIILHPNQCLL